MELESVNLTLEHPQSFPEIDTVVMKCTETRNAEPYKYVTAPAPENNPDSGSGSGQNVPAAGAPYIRSVTNPY